MDGYGNFRARRKVAFATVLCVLLSVVGVAAQAIDSHLHRMARRVEVVSGGLAHGNRVLIRYAGHTFFDVATDATAGAGIYVAAVLEDRVLLHSHYNTFAVPGASEGLAQDIDRLPDGTLVIAAVKDDATRLFDRRGQDALADIGVQRGLLGKPFRSSYLCIGTKGLEPGGAIERYGPALQRYVGEESGRTLRLQFPRDTAPDFSAAPGLHEGLMFGNTEVLYYIPRQLDPAKAEYVFLIHGAGDWHRPGAATHIAVWRELADRQNLVLVAPVFDCIHNRTVDPAADLDEFGRFRDRKIIRDWHLWDFVYLLNPHNVHRADLKLIEVFDFFRKKLIPRSKFILYGHSGGGQFVSRFAVLHPELLERAACSSAGTYAFPELHRDYPWGLSMDQLETTFGTHIKADDLRLDPKQRSEKLSRFLALELHVIVGSEETADDHPDSAWQGRNVYERADNFVNALRRARDPTDSAASGERARLGAHLYVMEGVGHDALKAGETAKRLLFPRGRD